MNSCIWLCTISSWQMQKTTSSWTKTRRNIHYTHTINNIYQYLSSSWIMWHTHPHFVLQHSIQFQITFLPSLHSNSQTPLPKSTSKSKLQVFFKVKGYIYYNIYIFLKYVMCIKLCYCFEMPLTKFFQAFLPTPFFPHKPCGFY